MLEEQGERVMVGLGHFEFLSNICMFRKCDSTTKIPVITGSLFNVHTEKIWYTFYLCLPDANYIVKKHAKYDCKFLKQ